MKFIIVLSIVIAIAYIISTRNEFARLRIAIKTENSNIGIEKAKRNEYLRDAMNIAHLKCQEEVNAYRTLTAEEKYDQLCALAERHPELRASAIYNNAMDEIATISSDITAKRLMLNATINKYNEAINDFPALLVAKACGYTAEQVIDEENLKAHKKLDCPEFTFPAF